MAFPIAYQNKTSIDVGIDELAYRYCDWLPEENGRSECYQQLIGLHNQASLSVFTISDYKNVRRQLSTAGRNFCETPQKNILCYSDVEQWLSSHDSLRKNLIELAEAAVQASINVER